MAPRKTKTEKPAAPEKSEVLLAIQALAKQRSIPEETLFTTLEEAMKAAYRKNLPVGELAPTNVVARIDRVDGSIHIYARLVVVEEVISPASQISVEDAQAIQPGAQVDDIVDREVTPKNFLRVAAKAAKERLMTTIRSAEHGKVYEEFAEKKDEVMTAVVQRVTDTDVYVSLGGTEGILEKINMIPGEVLHEDDHVRVYVLNVARTAPFAGRAPQIRVSRRHPNLVKRLFELEVPEVAAGQVLIKSIAREPGIRTKIAVASVDPVIDPVGACVGQGGGRVERVVSQLGGEKIDIIKWSEDPMEFVANALNPARVLTIFVNEETHTCRVIVPDNQLSLAIGKDGLNSRLASNLTGHWTIDIKSESEAHELHDMVDENGLTTGSVNMTMDYDESVGYADGDDTL